MHHRWLARDILHQRKGLISVFVFPVDFRLPPPRLSSLNIGCTRHSQSKLRSPLARSSVDTGFPECPLYRRKKLNALQCFSVLHVLITN